MPIGPTGYEDDDELLDQATLAKFRCGPGEVIEARVFWTKGVPRLCMWRLTNPTSEDDWGWESDPGSMISLGAEEVADLIEQWNEALVNRKANHTD